MKLFFKRKKNAADKYQGFSLSHHAKCPGFCKGAQTKWSKDFWLDVAIEDRRS